MPTAAPLVSVLMPVYQADRWLAEALESAFAQTFEDFELIAVDDGSTDRSGEILRAWAEREPRLRVFPIEHAGLPAARERSLREARGRFAAFLDADDAWLPHRLERQLPHADDATVVFANAYIRDASGAIVGTYAENVLAPPAVEWPASDLFSPLLWTGCFVPLPTVLAPLAALRSAGSFRKAERAGHGSTGGLCDFEMWLNLALRGLRFHYLDEPLAVYRGDGTGLSADPVRNCVEGLRIYDDLATDTAGDERRQVRHARRGMRRHLEVVHRKQAWSHVLRGDRPRARASLLASLRVRPLAPRSWLALLLFSVPPLIRAVAARGLPEAKRYAGA